MITEFSYYSKMSMSQRKVLKKAINNNDKVSQCDMGDYYSEKNSNHTDYEEAKKCMIYLQSRDMIERC